MKDETEEIKENIVGEDYSSPNTSGRHNSDFVSPTKIDQFGLEFSEGMSEIVYFSNMK